MKDLYVVLGECIYPEDEQSPFLCEVSYKKLFGCLQDALTTKETCEELYGDTHRYKLAKLTFLD